METDVVTLECAVCWALVPRHLMHFHREWHATVMVAVGRTEAQSVG